MRSLIVGIVCLLAFYSVEAFRRTAMLKTTRWQTTSALKLSTEYISLLTSAAEQQSADVDRVVYGSVNAPSWVLPVCSLLAILSAAIPILLRPGEKALEEQRVNEEITGNQFNKKKNSRDV